MRIVFRVDATPSIGSGHLMRCWVIAEEFIARQVSVMFICQANASIAIEFLKSKKIPYVAIEAAGNIDLQSSFEEVWCDNIQIDDAEKTIEALGDFRPHLCIVDSYQLDHVWQNEIAKKVQSILVIEDYPHRQHYCNFLLDQNSSEKRNKNNYLHYTPNSCIVLQGNSFALLNKKFVSLIRTNKVIVRKKISRVLVYFTSGPDQGLTFKALMALKKLGRGIRVDAISNPSNNDWKLLSQICNQYAWQIHSFVDDLSSLILKADLAIGGGGVTAIERCSLGLPSIVIGMAKNQKPLIDELNNEGAIISLGQSDAIQIKDIESAIQLLCENPLFLADLSIRSANLFDGLGVKRLADKLMNYESG
jgi:UDP-2,4-diacetamido-2,4,6-trideoxy-beta-L-altropyranose hydrolase